MRLRGTNEATKRTGFAVASFRSAPREQLTAAEHSQDAEMARLSRLRPLSCCAVFPKRMKTAPGVSSEGRFTW